MLLHMVLIVTGVLITLNFYLPGALKDQITVGLSVLLLGTIAAIWILHGWVAGLIAIPAAYVYFELTIPPVEAAAYRLLGHRTSAESGGEFSDLRALQSGKLSMNRYFERALRRTERERTELDRLIARAAVQATLQATGRSQSEIVELVWMLSRTGVGRDLALSAVVDPDLLRELLEMQEAGSGSLDLAGRVMKL